MRWAGDFNIFFFVFFSCFPSLFWVSSAFYFLSNVLAIGCHWVGELSRFSIWANPICVDAHLHTQTHTQVYSYMVVPIQSQSTILKCKPKDLQTHQQSDRDLRASIRQCIIFLFTVCIWTNLAWLLWNMNTVCNYRPDTSFTLKFFLFVIVCSLAWCPCLCFSKTNTPSMQQFIVLHCIVF